MCSCQLTWAVTGWRNGWMMYWRNADGGIYRATWGETGGNICEPSLRAPEDGEWQHFLFVYSDKGLPGSPELRAKLYVNGEVKTTEGSVGNRFYNSSNYANYNAPMTAFGRYMRTSDNLFEEGFAGYMRKSVSGKAQRITNMFRILIMERLK